MLETFAVVGLIIALIVAVSLSLETGVAIGFVSSLVLAVSALTHSV